MLINFRNCLKCLANNKISQVQIKKLLKTVIIYIKKNFFINHLIIRRNFYFWKIGVYHNTKNFNFNNIKWSTHKWQFTAC